PVSSGARRSASSPIRAASCARSPGRATAPYGRLSSPKPSVTATNVAGRDVAQQHRRVGDRQLDLQGVAPRVDGAQALERPPQARVVDPQRRREGVDAVGGGEPGQPLEEDSTQPASAPSVDHVDGGGGAGGPVAVALVARYAELLA